MDILEEHLVIWHGTQHDLCRSVAKTRLKPKYKHFHDVSVKCNEVSNYVPGRKKKQFWLKTDFSSLSDSLPEFSHLTGFL